MNLPASETRQGLSARAGPYLLSHDHSETQFSSLSQILVLLLSEDTIPCPRLVPSAHSLLGTFSAQHPQRRDD